MDVKLWVNFTNPFAQSTIELVHNIWHKGVIQFHQQIIFNSAATIYSQLLCGTLYNVCQKNIMNLLAQKLRVKCWRNQTHGHVEVVALGVYEVQMAVYLHVVDDANESFTVCVKGRR